MTLSPLSLAPQLFSQNLADKPTDRPDAEMAEMAKKFETSFLTPMVDEMLRTAGKATFGAGNAEEIWRSFMAGAIAEEITQSGSTGIADSLARQMKAYSG